jgi:hypothetical protein
VTGIVPADVSSPTYWYHCHATEGYSRLAPVAEPLSSRMGSCERLSAYGGCALRQVIGKAAFRRIE